MFTYGLNELCLYVCMYVCICMYAAVLVCFSAPEGLADQGGAAIQLREGLALGAQRVAHHLPPGE